MQNDQLTFEATIEFAQSMDQADPLRSFRDQFHFPVNEHGQEEIYFAGNSLGLQPRIVSTFVNEELEKWNTLGVRGHFESDFPWMPYHEFLSESMAEIVGAKAEEVVVMNSLGFGRIAIHIFRGRATGLIVE